MLEPASVLAVEEEYDDCFIYENCPFTILFHAQSHRDNPYEEENENITEYWRIVATQVDNFINI